ncbi:TerB family tellurite resistance protein [Maribacter sp. ACAM166]|uniref:tellurite resistance TerB family protein n=1 Tax=Maribacter sp. ACAM166 TaxID=2508996 RepID=UPI0010FDBE5F|nr:TerB family tellurite resistance protein [Maribacter sp. ACAM166]TLP81805.1 TerB family tellurite resistance protein [Maribacter sp. ACAM166]
MSILEAYESGAHESNVAHFAAIVKLATVDGTINLEEKIVLARLAFKLDVSDEEVKPILKHPEKYPLLPPYTLEERIERLHDLFSVIYADSEIDAEEQKLIYKYAIGLGFSSERATQEIEKCIRVFGGEAEFED